MESMCPTTPIEPPFHWASKRFQDETAPHEGAGSHGQGTAPIQGRPRPQKSHSSKKARLTGLRTNCGNAPHQSGLAMQPTLESLSSVQLWLACHAGLDPFGAMPRHSSQPKPEGRDRLPIWNGSVPKLQPGPSSPGTRWANPVLVKAPPHQTDLHRPPPSPQPDAPLLQHHSDRGHGPDSR